MSLQVNVYNQDELARWIRELIDKDDLHRFYTCSAWLKVRAEVLAEYKHECQHCKQRGYYTRATTVHHQQYVRRHPRLALTKKYTFKDKEYINLLPLCDECHKKVHNKQYKKKKPLTEERW